MRRNGFFPGCMTGCAPAWMQKKAGSWSRLSIPFSGPVLLVRISFDHVEKFVALAWLEVRNLLPHQVATLDLAVAIVDPLSGGLG